MPKENRLHELVTAVTKILVSARSEEEKRQGIKALLTSESIEMIKAERASALSRIKAMRGEFFSSLEYQQDEVERIEWRNYSAAELLRMNACLSSSSTDEVKEGADTAWQAQTRAMLTHSLVVITDENLARRVCVKLLTSATSDKQDSWKLAAFVLFFIGNESTEVHVPNKRIIELLKSAKSIFTTENMMTLIKPWEHRSALELALREQISSVISANYRQSYAALVNPAKRYPASLLFMLHGFINRQITTYPTLKADLQKPRPSSSEQEKLTYLMAALLSENYKRAHEGFSTVADTTPTEATFIAGFNLIKQISAKDWFASGVGGWFKRLLTGPDLGLRAASKQHLANFLRQLGDWLGVSAQISGANNLNVAVRRCFRVDSFREHPLRLFNYFIQNPPPFFTTTGEVDLSYGRAFLNLLSGLHGGLLYSSNLALQKLLDPDEDCATLPAAEPRNETAITTVLNRLLPETSEASVVVDVADPGEGGAYVAGAGVPSDPTGSVGFFSNAIGGVELTSWTNRTGDGHSDSSARPNAKKLN